MIRIVLLLVFIAVPLLEIALLIKAGSSFGFWPTIAIVIFTAFLGTFMLRWQGLSVMARANEALRAGRMPVESVADGVFLLLAGAFLLTPGLLTDGVGFAFLVPQVRRWLGKKILAGLSRRMSMDEFEGASGPQARPARGSRPSADRARRPGRTGRAGKVVIDADYKEIDPD